MLKTVKIANYKSIVNQKIELGRLNVFIGENGAGKSNILEALALAGAADARKLDNEFLIARGVRVTLPKFMRSNFEAESAQKPIEITLIDTDGFEVRYSLTNDGKPYSSWKAHTHILPGESDNAGHWLAHMIMEKVKNLPADVQVEKLQEAAEFFIRVAKDAEFIGPRQSFEERKLDLDFGDQPDDGGIPQAGEGSHRNFIIYSPENSALRTFAREGQVEPLGVNGEGLLKLLQVMGDDPTAGDVSEVSKALKMLNWFKSMEVVEADSHTRMDIVDRFLDPVSGAFDQRSANEGFLFLAFYFTLLVSTLTPKFFAIDNVDASLNPKLCQALMEKFVTLTRAHDKQVILTTHQPAILDGIDLNDDEQRLFVVSRTSSGMTKIKRFVKKVPSDYPRRLSELFLSGAIGGVPKRF